LKFNPHFKSIFTKALFFVIVTFVALATLFPTFENRDYEFAIIGKIAIYSFVVLTITELIKLLYKQIQTKWLYVIVVIFYAVISVVSLFLFANYSKNYVQEYTTNAKLYPPRTQQDSKSFSQFRIVTSEVKTELKDSISEHYADNPLLLIQKMGGIINNNRRKVYEENSLKKNEKTLREHFFRSILFFLIFFTTIVELIAYFKQKKEFRTNTSKSGIEIHKNIENPPKVETLSKIHPNKNLSQSSELVSKGRAREVFPILSEICPEIPHFQDQLKMIQSQLNQAEHENSHNLIDNQSFTIKKNRIDKAILDFINELKIELKK